MGSPNARPNRPKSRQSTANITSSKDIGYDKENATADLSSMRKRKLAASDTEEKKKRSRSKSLGPGGLEALKESAGNTAKVASSYPGSIITIADEMTGISSDADQVHSQAYCASDPPQSHSDL
jgi:hypothetical protein